MNYLNIIKNKSNNYIQIKSTDNEFENGENLIKAYNSVDTQGLGLFPEGRFTIFLEPAIYNLGSRSLLLTKNYVDIIGLDGASKSVIASDLAFINNGTIYQFLDDIILKNLEVLNYNTSYSYPWFVDQASLSQNQINQLEANLDIVPCVYYRAVPNGQNNGKTIIENVNFSSLNMSIPTMRIGASYQGTYINCKAGDWAFGFQGRANGKYYNCEAGNFSFGSFGITAGYFENCKGRSYCFGAQNSNCSAKFVRCYANDNSFGAGSLVNEAQLIDCEIENLL